MKGDLVRVNELYNVNCRSLFLVLLSLSYLSSLFLLLEERRILCLCQVVVEEEAVILYNDDAVFIFIANASDSETPSSSDKSDSAVMNFILLFII